MCIKNEHLHFAFFTKVGPSHWEFIERVDVHQKKNTSLDSTHLNVPQLNSSKDLEIYQNIAGVKTNSDIVILHKSRTKAFQKELMALVDVH